MGWDGKGLDSVWWCVVWCGVVWFGVSQASNGKQRVKPNTKPPLQQVWCGGVWCGVGLDGSGRVGSGRACVRHPLSKLHHHLRRLHIALARRAARLS